MTTYEKIKEWARAMKDNSFKVMLTDDGHNYRELILLNKLEKEKVLYIKGDRRPVIISPKFMDLPETGKAMVINITSVEDMDKPEKGITAYINLKEPKQVDALKKVVEGTVEFHFYSISNDLTEISAKLIFDTEESKVALEMELETAGLA